MSKSTFLIPAIVTAASFAVSASALDLKYEGFIAGTKAGTARVRIESEGENYTVTGRMRTDGFWDLVVPWNARFTVVGRVENGRAVPLELRLREKDKRKDRTIRVAGGILRQVKNGKERPERPAPRGVDVMSAFWVTTKCDEEQVLNNGRHHYTMTLTKHTNYANGSERCDYRIVDDDGDKWRGWILLGTRHGRRVPEKIVMIDGVETELQLVKATLVNTEAEGQLLAELEPEAPVR